MFIKLTSFIFKRFQLDFLQWNNMLLIILFLIYDNVAIHQDVIEEKKLTGLWLLAAHFCQDTFSHQNPALFCQRLKKHWDWTSNHIILIFISPMIVSCLYSKDNNILRMEITNQSCNLINKLTKKSTFTSLINMRYQFGQTHSM